MQIALWTFFVEALFCSAFAPMIPADSFSASLFVILVNAAAMVFGILYAKKSPQITAYLLLGFFLRLFLLYFDLYCKDIFVLPSSGQDSERFARQAAEFYMTGVDPSRGFLYVRWIVFLYNFFGANRAIAQYSNVLLGMWMIFIAIRMLEQLEVSERTLTSAAALLCFLPYTAIMQVLLLREAIVMFLLCVSLHWFLQWMEGRKYSTLAFSVLAVIAASLFHSGSLAILLGEAIAFVLYDHDTGEIDFRPSSIWALLLIIVGFAVLYTQFGDALFRKFRGIEDSADIIRKSNAYTKGSAAYEAGFRIANPTLNLIVNTPIRMLYFVASPMPWTWRGVQDVIAFVFSALFYIIVYWKAFVVLRIQRSSEYRTIIVLMLFFMLASAMMFAWGVANSGAAMRHRDKFVIIHIITYALCEASDIQTEPETDPLEHEDNA